MANRFLNYTGLNIVISKLKNYIDSLLKGKVDKETGYGLSQNNFTKEEKEKLAKLEPTTIQAADIFVITLDEFKTAVTNSKNKFTRIHLGADLTFSTTTLDLSNCEIYGHFHSITLGGIININGIYARIIDCSIIRSGSNYINLLGTEGKTSKYTFTNVVFQNFLDSADDKVVFKFSNTDKGWVQLFIENCNAYHSNITGTTLKDKSTIIDTASSKGFSLRIVDFIAGNNTISNNNLNQTNGFKLIGTPSVNCQIFYDDSIVINGCPDNVTKIKINYKDTEPTSNSDNLITSGAVYTALQTVSNSIPTIPENVSAFNNDAGYLTEHQSLENYPILDNTDDTYTNTYNTRNAYNREIRLFTDVKKSELDGNVKYQTLYFLDSDKTSNSRLGQIENAASISSSKMSMRVYSPDSEKSAEISISRAFDVSSAVTTYAPNPSSTSNDNNIATTSWVRSLIKVEKLSSNTTASAVLSNKKLISLYIGWSSSSGSGCYIWAEQEYENAKFYLQSGGSKTINMGSPLSSLASMGGINFAVMVYI